MIYKIQTKDYYDRLLYPYECTKKGQIDIFEFIKILTTVDGNYLNNISYRGYFLYDYQTIIHIIEEIYSNKNTTSFASGRSLYLFRKFLGVFNDGESQSIEDVEKEYHEIFEIKDDQNEDGFLDMMETIFDKIFDISYNIIREKTKNRNSLIYEEEAEGSMEFVDCLFDDYKIKVDKRLYKVVLLKRLKENKSIITDNYRVVLSKCLSDRLTRLADLDDFSDLLNLSKYLSLYIPLTQEQEEELKFFVHSTGSLFKDETVEEVCNEMLENIYLYDWKHPAKPTRFYLDSSLYDLPLSDQTIDYLFSHDVKTLKELFLWYKKHEEFNSAISESEKEAKSLVLRLNVGNYINNSDKIIYSKD